MSGKITGARVCAFKLSPLEDGSNLQFCSRAEPFQSFGKSPFFAIRDPLSLEPYVECQLWENGETGEAKLKMLGGGVLGCQVFTVPPHCYFAVPIVIRRRAQCPPPS